MENKIRFHFHPYQIKEKLHAVEKADSTGNKHRYLCGVASGLKVDEHGERMTQKCITSFMQQANSGNILLYADLHNVRSTDDIGILSHAEILESGDWYIENRLYDESDGIGPVKLDTANTLWKQVNGLPPYVDKDGNPQPRQKGFSIEGIVPENGILSQNLQGQRTLDDVTLDGVVVVPRPAYKDSIVHAVYKALGMPTPWELGKVIKSINAKIAERLQEQDLKDRYYQSRYQITDALEEEIEEIMVGINQNKKELLNAVFDEYKNLMVQLILQSESVFAVEESPVLIKSVRKAQIYNKLKAYMKQLEYSFKTEE